MDAVCSNVNDACMDAVWSNVNDACVWMLYGVTSMMRVYGCCMGQRQ